MSRFIPLSVPSIRGNEWKYVKECLDTEWVSSVGSYVDLFEEKIRAYTGAQHAVACVNGTSALQVALRIAGVKEGDEVIVPTLTFIAPVNVVRYLGGDPVFMDCDGYYNIDVEKTCEFIEKETELREGWSFNKSTGRRISAIIPVHVFGNAVKLEELIDTCSERNIEVIEDASESLGTRYTRGRYSGRHTGTVAGLGCYSFNGNKIITTGAGGMIIARDTSAAKIAKYLTTQAKDDPVRYIHGDIGYNFRMSNVQAAIGVAQMEKLDEYVDIKRSNYSVYAGLIDGIDGLDLAPVPDYADSNYWFYCLQIDSGRYGMDREQLMEHLSVNGVQSRPVWHLNHLQRPYEGCLSYRIERAPELHRKTLNIPCSTNLTGEDVETVAGLLRERKR